MIRVGEELKERFDEALINTSLNKSIVFVALIKKFLEKPKETLEFLFD